MTTETIIGNIISGIVGGGTVAVVTHFLTKDREKQRDLSAADSANRRRKQEFLGFLKQWRMKIHLQRTTNPTTVGVNVHDAAYRDGVADFEREVMRVRDVFLDSKKFDFLTKRLGSLKPDDWKDKNNPRDVICEAIDELVKFAT